MLPPEWYGDDGIIQTANPVYVAIETAVANGIHVVEIAGNGRIDLDALTWYGDSGAIIVGAGDIADGAAGYEYADNLQPTAITNYGLRVNVQGQGVMGYTTGYGYLYNLEGANLFYTDRFCATSCAAATVAGAVACAQGLAYGKGLGPLDPLFMRGLLISTGTPQNLTISASAQDLIDTGLIGYIGYSPLRNIGPRPNLYNLYYAL